MRTYIDVAVLAKTKNAKGRFAAKSAAGLPFLLEPGDEVFLVPPQTDVPRTAVVQDVRLVGEDAAELAFRGIDELGIAQQMVSMHCLIRRDSIDDSVFEQAPGTWEGWKFVDEELGEIGHVSGLIENPAQALLEVERADGGGSLLVPVVDEIIRHVDIEGQVILANVPNGLLDL